MRRFRIWREVDRVLSGALRRFRVARGPSLWTWAFLQSTRAKLKPVARGRRRTDDEAPVSAGEHLYNEIASGVGVSERLPVVWIEGLCKNGARGKGTGCIESCVTRPIAVWA